MYHEGITINSNVFTSAFYTLVGFHGAHVTVGLMMLTALLVFLSITGKIGAGQA